MTRRYVTIEWTTTHRKRVAVDAPDTITRAEQEAAFEAACEGVDFDDPDESEDHNIESVAWGDNPPTVLPDPDGPAEPPEAAWIEVDGHQWATTRRIAIRRDGPRPAGIPPRERWLTHGEISPDQLRPVLYPEGGPTQSHPRTVVDARYAPLLAAGKVKTWPGGGDLTPIYVHRDGELVAVVMPVRRDMPAPFPTVKVAAVTSGGAPCSP